MSQKVVSKTSDCYEEAINRINQQIKAAQEKGELLLICSKCETILITRNTSKCPECGNTDLI